MRALLIVLSLLTVPAVVAEPVVGEATLPLGEGELRWRRGEGLTLRYREQRLWLPGGSDLVLHDPAWTTQHWNSSNYPPTGELQRDGQRHLLTLVYEGGGMAATQTISAEPNGRFGIVWRLRQDNWQPASLQLTVAKPAEAFLAGAQFEATVGGKPVSGTIPEVFDPKRKQPVAGATAMVFRSLFGTVDLKASEPLAVYDYEKRNGAFWLGFDRPLPRGEEQTFSLSG
ncbi:MAG: hypothetical protein HUU35_06805, partial [Armatimonadetes bacterium]|nr:hypothetical protein [Armatimonadota bacterium]